MSLKCDECKEIFITDMDAIFNKNVICPKCSTNGIVKYPYDINNYGPPYERIKQYNDLFVINYISRRTKSIDKDKVFVECKCGFGSKGEYSVNFGEVLSGNVKQCPWCSSSVPNVDIDAVLESKTSRLQQNIIKRKRPNKVGKTEHTIRGNLSNLDDIKEIERKLAKYKSVPKITVTANNNFSEDKVYRSTVTNKIARVNKINLSNLNVKYKYIEDDERHFIESFIIYYLLKDNKIHLELLAYKIINNDFIVNENLKKYRKSALVYFKYKQEKIRQFAVWEVPKLKKGLTREVIYEMLSNGEISIINPKGKFYCADDVIIEQMLYDKNIGRVKDDIDLFVKEGNKRLITHYKRERNQEIVKKAKEQFKSKHGRLFCEICKFDFNIYRVDYAEAHHTNLVSEMDENSITRIEDLVMLCPNCHTLIHKLDISVEILKKVINERR